MKQHKWAKHKWHKEICAWADGAEIEQQFGKTWHQVLTPGWVRDAEYRIKPQPKEPQYLYVWKNNIEQFRLSDVEPHPLKEYVSTSWKCIGKIKLEVDDA